jgi:hypothetical protein
MDPKEIEWEGIDWIYLTEDNDQQQALLRTGDLSITLCFFFGTSYQLWIS